MHSFPVRLQLRVDKRPILGDLRDSGSIGQDAEDVVMFILEGYPACEEKM